MFRLDTEEEKLKWEDDLYFCPGLVNIQELPEVIQEKYAERGEFRQARTLQDGTLCIAPALMQWRRWLAKGSSSVSW